MTDSRPAGIQERIRRGPTLLKDGRRIAEMFDRVAPRYDLLNRVLSLGIDRRWRRALAQELEGTEGRVVDLCTGTGDVMLAAARAHPSLRFVGVDFSPGMIRRAVAKCCDRTSGHRLAFAVGDATSLAVASGSAGAVTIAFGIRNVADVEAALREVHRVLRPGGRLIVLEFSLPRSRPLRSMYLFYFRRVLPVIGGVVSGAGAAYRYLPLSVLQFPEGDAFLARLRDAGFGAVREHRLTFGITSLYVGEKLAADER